MKYKNNKFVKHLTRGTIAFTLLFGASTGYAAGVLNVTNWAEYIAEDTVANFEKEFDVKVTYDNYDSEESIQSKLLAGNSGYDVVSHSSASVAKLIPADILQKLDKSKLSNLEHIMDSLTNQLDLNIDPGNHYFIPYMWGTHGVTYNKALVLETYPEAPIGSMDMVFDPVHMKELGKCGVAFLDSPTDILPMALAHMGLDPYSANKADYQAAEEMLSAIRPYIKTFDNYAYQQMPLKEFCIAVTWGPDGLLAMSGAVEANTGVELDFFIPPGEGKAVLWIDGLVIPSDAKNVENAHLFINYMMRPEVAAANSNYTWYASGNKSAFDLIDPAVTSSPAAYPTAESVAKMYTYKAVPRSIQRARTRAWTKFKSGQ